MKTNKKVLAGAMAILLATGGITNKAFAEEDKRPYEVNPPTIDQDRDDTKVFNSKEEAEKAAKEALKNDPINNGYELSYFGDFWYYTLIIYDEDEEPEKKPTEEEPEKKPTEEEPEKKPTEEENKVFNDNVAKINAFSELTAEEKASYEKKLKEVSKDEKAMDDIIAEAQKLNEERVEAKKEPEPDKNVDKDDTPVVKENNEVGFTTKEDAEKAAKEALKDDKINNSYNVSQGKDGKYYYVLSPVVEETKKKEQVKQKPVVNKNAKHAASNPKTGIASLSSVGTLLSVASAAYLGTKKRK